MARGYRYREQTARKSDLERADLSKAKTGVFTGAYAIIRPTTKRCRSGLPITCCSVTAREDRRCPRARRARLEFARKFDLPLAVVVQPTGNEPAIGFTGDGIAINSPIINGLTRPGSEEENHCYGWRNTGHGKRAINYKLRAAICN